MDDAYSNVGHITDFPIGSLRKVVVSGEAVLVTNIGGKLFAVSDSCTHRGGPLSNGELDGNIVICPWHGGQFEITTGKVISPPPMKGFSVFDVKINGAEVLLKKK